MNEDKPRFQPAVAQKAFKCEDCKGDLNAGQSFFWDSERKAGPRQYSWRICPPCQAKVTGPGASKSVFGALDGSSTPQSDSNAIQSQISAILYELAEINKKLDRIEATQNDAERQLEQVFDTKS